MRFEVSRDLFARAMDRISNVIDRKSTLAILSMVKITADDETVTFEATDYDVVLKLSIFAKVAEKGAAVVPGKLLQDMVKALPTGDVVFANEKAGSLLESYHTTKFVLTGGKSKYGISGTPADEYPLLQNIIEEKGAWSFPVQMLLAMVKKVAYCMSDEEARMNLNGVYFDLQGERKQVSMAATDGHRMSKLDASFEEVPGCAVGATMQQIVHRRGVSMIAKILDDSVDAVTVAKTGAGGLAFCSGGVQLFIRCIDENYPDIDSVIPSTRGTKLRLGLSAALAAMSQVKCTLDSVNPVTSLSWDGETMKFATKNTAGAAESETPIVEFVLRGDNSTGEICFNYRYLLEALKSFGSENVDIYVTSSSDPAILEPAKLDGQKETVISLLMPIDQV